MARILVVDDTKEIRDLVQTLLMKNGNDVMTAPDAMAAMEMLANYRFDLGIFDIEMPYTNGFQLAQTLRNSIRYKFFPIIFLTARKEKQDIERAIHVKADKYILKPIQKELFLESVNLILQKGTPENFLKIDIDKTNVKPQAMVIHRSHIRLKTVSEIGVTVISTSPLSATDLVNLDTSLFAQIGIPSLPLKVSFQKQMSDTEWEVSMMFMHANHEIVIQIKTWLAAQS